MAKVESITCDCCGARDLQYPDNRELNLSVNGADLKDPIDLCRSCEPKEEEAAELDKRIRGKLTAAIAFSAIHVEGKTFKLYLEGVGGVRIAVQAALREMRFPKKGAS